jgi:acyl carrier protein
VTAAEAGARLDPVGLRALVVEHCGFDPGDLDDDARLADVGLVGVHRLSLLTVIEDAFDVEFPADLMTALDTVDDLLHYTNLKLEQLR